jgi:hypothetical protein
MFNKTCAQSEYQVHRLTRRRFNSQTFDQKKKNTTRGDNIRLMKIKILSFYSLCCGLAEASS